MSLEALLGEHEKKSEILSEIEKIKEEAKSLGSHKASQEAKGLRERLNRSKNMVKELLGFDLESDSIQDDIKELLEKIEKAPKGDDSQIKQLQKQVETLQKSWDEEKTKTKELKRENWIKEVKTNVSKALSQEKALDSDLADVIFNKLDLSNDEISPDQVLFKGDDALNIFDGVKKYFEEKPHLRINSSHPGGGSTENKGNAGGNAPDKPLTPAQKIAQGFNMKG